MNGKRLLRAASVRASSASGFSLIEIIVTLALIAVLGGMAAVATTSAITLAKSDASIISTVDLLETARNRSIAERRNIELNFIGDDRIRLVRRELAGAGTTLLSEVGLEHGQKLHRFTGAPDTPDQFGGVGAVNFGGVAPVMFTSDGSLIDSNGDVVNGTIFLGSPDQPETARALTVFGVTGLIRTFRWAPAGWVE